MQPFSSRKSGTCCVAFALNSKKLRKSSIAESSDLPIDPLQPNPKNEWRGGGLADILNVGTQDGVRFIPFEASTDETYDVIVHKLTEDLDKEEQSERVSSITEYICAHPEVVVVDPFDSVKILISRATTTDMLEKIVCAEFEQPKHLKFHEPTSPEEIARVMAERGVVYPIICKQLSACGTPISHHMIVVVDFSGLSLLTFPCLLQQYHDHGAVFYKAYVLGDEIMVFQRTSLPDLAEKAQKHKFRSLAFDSRFDYPKLEDFSMPETSGFRSVDMESFSPLASTLQCPKQLMTTETPSYRMKVAEFPDSIAHFKGNFEKAAEAISEECGLTLYGFDVIIPTGSERILVIDINFFPSYKEVPDFPTRLRQYFRKRAGFSINADDNGSGQIPSSSR